MLVRLIVYFVLVITITLFASSYFIYSYFSSSFKSEITDFNHKVLNQVSIISDEFILKSINELALNQITDTTRSPEMKALFDDYSIDNWDHIFDAEYKLDSLVFQNREVVDSIFVHSKSNNLLISSSMKVIKYIDEKSAAASEEFYWINTFYKSNKSILWLKTRNTRVYSYSANGIGDIITVICSYPTSATGDAIKGFIAVNIKEEALSNYLIKFNSSNSGQFMILDSDGTIVTHSDKSNLYKNITKENFVKTILISTNPKDFKTVYEKTEYVVSFIKSNYSNWYYVSLVPTELFYQRDGLIKKKIFIVSLIILFIVLILSNILSLNIYTPFKRILDKYSPSTGIDNVSKKGIKEYNLLDSLFNNLFSKISNLQNTLNKNALMIKHNLLIDLLNNHFPTPDNLENMLNLLNIKLSKKHYCAVIFSLYKEIIDLDQSNIQLYKYNIIDFIDSLSEDSCIYIPVDIRKESICVIMNTDSIQHDDIVQFVSQVENFCFDKLNIQIVTGTGRFLEELLSINKSYIDAKICLQYKFILPHKNALYYNEINITTNAIPGDILDKFDKFLKLGIYNEVKETLNKFLSTVICDNIPYREVRHTISGFITLYRKFLESMNIEFEQIINEQDRNILYSPHNINVFVDTLLNIIHTTNNFISNKKQSKNAELANKIKQYVLNNLHQDISLNSAAEAFYISPFHLSKFFKEETGINYIDYVMNCKMDKAKNLLTSTTLRIEKITNLIGYSHATYFSRKFKELTGKTPAEYRNDAHIQP